MTKTKGGEYVDELGITSLTHVFFAFSRNGLPEGVT